MFKPIIEYKPVSKWLLVLNMIVAIVYLSWWFQIDRVANPWLYGLLLMGEIYHVIMAILFWITLWPHVRTKPMKWDMTFAPSVDVFITVAGEPVDILEKTAVAAKRMTYPNHKVYILNDGYVANKDNWKDVEKMAKRIGVGCITRKVSGGAKAGNVNNGLEQTKGELVVILDTDMVPHDDFLTRTVPYFKDRKVGFVQTPQFYNNSHTNQVSMGAWEQQALFFGPIMRGKDGSNSAFICGTNIVIRRKALVEAGGMCEENIAEDFLTSLEIHRLGWKSHYVPDVLVEGLAPEDLLSYFKQQLRWARGSMEVLFGENPLLKKGLSWGQKLQYLSSAMYYFNGVIVLIDVIMPVLVLCTGMLPVQGTTTSFIFYFVPFMALNLFTLYEATNETVTFRAMSFSQSSAVLQLQALKSIVLRQKMGFSITPKKAQSGNFLSLVYPHLGYGVVVVLAAGIGLYREGMSPSIATNIAWAGFNFFMFIPFIEAAYPWGNLMKADKKRGLLGKALPGLLSLFL